jgi:acetate kinase
MTEEILITFNAGSSSLKLGAFSCHLGQVRAVGRGKISLDDKSSGFVFETATGRQEHRLPGYRDDDLAPLIRQAIDLILGEFPGRLVGVAHRVVHGGPLFSSAALLDPETVARIEGLVDLAPLHQPQALRMIEAIRALLPDLPQTASFDTAFHASMPDTASRFAIPRSMHDEGLRRYGFHGVSYKYIAGELQQEVALEERNKVIVAHLGSGASLCAMLEGKSLDTSMGFSALDGVPMATRPGWIDPGLLIHLLKKDGLGPDQLEDFLYHRCGLLGVSGTSGDIRALIDDGSSAAVEAIDLYCFRIAGEIGRLTVSLGGLDTIVFTAGVGENQPEIRARVCGHLAWLGLALDEDSNSRNARFISAASSAVKALVIPTDEEQILADEAWSLLRADHQS